MMINVNEPILININNPEGNAYYILDIFKKYLKKSKVPDERIDELFKEAKSGDYKHLLEVISNNSEIYFME